MKSNEVYQKILSAGYELDGYLQGKMKFKKEDNYILFCAPCGWIKKGQERAGRVVFGQPIKFYLLTNLTI